MPAATLVDAVSAWYAENARDLPWRRRGVAPWAVLVSEVMLQQTPVSRVLPVYEAWLRRWPTPVALAAEPAGEAIRLWGRLGYPRRALRLHAAASVIVERHGGVLPRTLHELLALPGVGDYTARAVAVFALGQRHPVLDTNVRRVVARAVEGRPHAPLTRRDLLLVDELLPAGTGPAAVASIALMELGALVCTARSPQCQVCPLAARCRWLAAGRPTDETPARRRATRYEGTDRQARGRLLAVLRAAATPVAAADLELAWPEPVQRVRALESLLADGLVTARGDGRWSLPS